MSTSYEAGQTAQRDRAYGLPSGSPAKLAGISIDAQPSSAVGETVDIYNAPPSCTSADSSPGSLVNGSKLVSELCHYEGTLDRQGWLTVWVPRTPQMHLRIDVFGKTPDQPLGCERYRAYRSHASEEPRDFSYDVTGNVRAVIPFYIVCWNPSD